MRSLKRRHFYTDIYTVYAYTRLHLQCGDVDQDLFFYPGKEQIFRTFALEIG
jgi:hypothetical protein